MTVRFRLLGPVEADVDGAQLELGHARQRCVLTALLVDADRTVPVDVLLERVWAGRLPGNARVTLSGYVSRLRQLLAVAGVGLIRQADGYRLTVDPMAVDLHRFRALVTQAAASRDNGPALLTEALELWRGPAFATLDTPWLDDVRDGLASERLAAELDRNDLALTLDQGQPTTMVSELSASAADNPWNERLAGQLMLALYRCGRQAEALHRYELLRSRLAHEFGVDPSPPLQHLHLRILRADPALAGTITTAPRQLPAPPASFIGRTRELANLATIRRASPSTMVTVAVTGTAGVGKTALALHWAHQIADEFPDGQLYANLRGFDPGNAIPPETAILGFLEALGVAPQRVPSSLDEQAALYRSIVAGRRMLVVLDNARDADQVQPLLPGSPDCLVLVTSRSQLTSLIATQDARPVTLDLLTTEEATDLLARRIGSERVVTDPVAVTEILTRCARLPLALTIVAARAAAHPNFPLQALATELHDTHNTLDALTDTTPRTDVRAVFSWSCNTLSPAGASLFRLLGLHPGPDFSAPAAASIIATPLPRVKPLLAELTRAHLLTEHVPGRYTCHDLLRVYATEQAHLHQTGPERHGAAHRMHEHYVHTAHAATNMIDPYQDNPPTLSLVEDGVVVNSFTDKDHAIAWFTAEHAVLHAAIDHAARNGFEHHTWSLAWALSEYSFRQAHWLELGNAFVTALRCAERLADQRGQAHAHFGLAITQHMQDQHEHALNSLRHAAKLYDELGDGFSQSGVYRTMSMVADKLGWFRDALDHAQRALDLQGAQGTRISKGRALNCVGWSHSALGDHHLALPHLEQSLALLQSTDDWPGLAAVWDSLGYTHQHLGHYARAVEAYQHALRADAEVGHRYCQAETLHHLGDTHHIAGDQNQAAVAWQQALTIYDDLGHPAAASEVRAKLASSQTSARSTRT
ncbi:BTAD domain-containing putative transcriptional regulator [Lentzea sp. BCCO 10_0798]|uniref:BTAD domain-containing putative transcriptional regulator n=1 Tax=Lentzea kristufekii TaxID=3095430 RepID=A0ABU4U205_9PSEU|nr:BTAD domain-containing putative transcriptional regulator [Lentzea sp. BCCO 10_0798]MDX8054482.1 BTAD domain-containing putative transcriptional regulator [Lentzea sp. BCCO 10_0798]